MQRPKPGATFAEALLQKKFRTASNTFGRNVWTLSSRSVGDLSHILLDYILYQRNGIQAAICKVEQSATGNPVAIVKSKAHLRPAQHRTTMTQFSLVDRSHSCHSCWLPISPTQQKQTLQIYHCFKLLGKHKVQQMAPIWPCWGSPKPGLTVTWMSLHLMHSTACLHSNF